MAKMATADGNEGKNDHHRDNSTSSIDQSINSLTLKKKNNLGFSVGDDDGSLSLNNCRIFLSNVGRRNDDMEKKKEGEGDDTGQTLLLDSDKSKLKQELIDWFQQYGDVSEVFLPDRHMSQKPQQKPYAFVTMSAPESAKRALVGESTKYCPLFQKCLPAPSIRNKRHQKEKASKKQNDAYIQKLLSKSNIICQGSKSHMKRFQDYVEQSIVSPNNNDVDGEVIGHIQTDSKSMVLFFLYSSSPKNFLSQVVLKDWFVKPIIHRSMIMQRQLTTTVEGEEKQPSSKDELNILKMIILDTLKGDIMTKTLQQDSSNAATAIAKLFRIRLQIFPPRLLQPVFTALHDYSKHDDDDINDVEWEEFRKKNVEYTPKNPTHTLTIIRVSERTFAIGGLEPLPIVNKNAKINKNKDDDDTQDDAIKNKRTKKQNDAICRAHWKLQEAFERYPYDLPSTTSSSSLIALDCGSAPGGWTRCVADKFLCHRIYSVDPGAMDDSVLQIPCVKHVPMTIQNAFDWLLKEEGGNATRPIVNIWVSDMCFKDMEQQVTLFLQAKRLGVVGSGTFFVMTLKCLIGYSDATFDKLCQIQAEERLRPVCKNLHRSHLFTNRISERTLIGYLK